MCVCVCVCVCVCLFLRLVFVQVQEKFELSQKQWELTQTTRDALIVALVLVEETHGAHSAHGILHIRNNRGSLVCCVELFLIPA